MAQWPRSYSFSASPCISLPTPLFTWTPGRPASALTQRASPGHELPGAPPAAPQALQPLCLSFPAPRIPPPTMGPPSWLQEGKALPPSLWPAPMPGLEGPPLSPLAALGAEQGEVSPSESLASALYSRGSDLDHMSVTFERRSSPAWLRQRWVTTRGVIRKLPLRTRFACLRLWAPPLPTQGRLAQP